MLELWVLPWGAVGSRCTWARDLDMFNLSFAPFDIRCGKQAALAHANGIVHTLSGRSSGTLAPGRGASLMLASRKALASLGLPVGDLPAPKHLLPGSLAMQLWL